MTSSDNLSYEISWIHISDIHETGQPGTEDQHRKIIFQRLLEDLDRRSEIGAPDPEIVIVTGDIAMSGGTLSPDEYREASVFLRSLVSRLGVGTRLMIVPGNHDVARVARRDAPTLRMLTAARAGTESLDDLLAREQDSALLEARLRDYKEFLHSLNDIDSEVSYGSILTGWSRLAGGRTFQVRFVGLNTAVLANDDTDQGKLQLGYTQLRTASQEAASEVGMVLLTHHPLEWLSDGDSASAIINEYFDLHLYGHLHLPQSRRSTLSQSQGLISIGAGATYHGLSGAGLGAGEYTYAICALGWDQSGHLKVRFWPRVWSARAGRWQTDHAILDRGIDYGTFDIPRHRRDPATLASPPDAGAAWRRWSLRTLVDFGNRRTAYPLDLTIGELFEREVNIATNVYHYASDKGNDGRALTDITGDENPQFRSILLLGEPGAGKSVAAYEVARAFSSEESFPVILRASEFKALLSPGHEYAEVMSQAVKNAAEWGFKVCLIIDGLDEMSGSDNAITLAGDFIAGVARAMDVVVTCRRREFEEEISRWISVATFSSILRVKEWTLQSEFSEYVRRLVGARLLSDTEILNAVRISEVLTDLITRPLFARMLTYVGVGDSRSVDSATGLYERYLSRLSSSCETSLTEAGITGAIDPMSIWRIAGRIIFENKLIIDEELNYSAAERIIAYETGTSAQTIRRTMAYLLDIRDKGAAKYAQFVHYSFFEYLVASALHSQLVNVGTLEDAPDIGRRLQHDLPRRMRHFLTELLSSTEAAPVGQLLVEVYQRSQQIDLRLAVRRTICNLIAYVISRSKPSESHLLIGLLDEEDDPFLRDSLLWAVSHAGDLNGALQFIHELDGSIARREMNRGYLLYYHGDFSHDAEPPFMDTPPLRSWSFTRREVLEMISDANYTETVMPARQAIDLYTFFDFCISRGEIVRGRPAVRLRTLVDNLWISAAVVPEIGSRLLSQVAICTDVQPSVE
jgi:predicted MPP superfamily phosphohydrolase